MPHQCLHCGEVFEDLTEDILFNGCTSCHKKKFTLTKDPMTDEERKDLLDKREGEIRELIRRSQEGEKPTVIASTSEPGKKEKVEWVGLSSEDTPEVINVVEPGVYEINIDKLMEDSPIIINKDGSYMVYLPSIFKKKKKRWR
jgi:predicted  nucleic acid-binding Zn-ribbon protein